MSILRPEMTQGGETSSTPKTLNSRENGLRKALGALLIATAGIAGCSTQPEQPATKQESQPAGAPSTPASSASSQPANVLLPSGEKPLDKVRLPDLVKTLFNRETGNPAFASMETGGSKSFGHFKVGSRVRAIRVATDTEIKPEDITQVNCTEGDKNVTDLFIKISDDLYRLPDCERPQIKNDARNACVNLSFPLPLTAKQKENLTFVATSTNEERIPDETLFQFGQVMPPGTKPGCIAPTAPVTTTTPTPTTPRTYTVVPSTPKKYVTREDYDKDKAAQAERDDGQDSANKATQAEVDALKAYWSCHNPDNSIKQACKEANQGMADQASKPRN